MKRLLTLILLLFFIVGFAQKKTYNIGMLLDNRTAEVDPLIKQMQDQIQAVVGEDANIQFSEDNILVNNYNLQNAEQNYNLLLRNVDIILAFGVVNSVVVNKQNNHQKPTILFGAVNNDFNTIDLNKKTSGIHDFTYLIDSQSYIEDLKKLKELTDFKKVGIVIEEAFVTILPLKETFNVKLKEIGANYKLIPFKNVDDITSQLDEDIDAVYIAGGFFLTNNETKQLAETFINKGLPSFTVNSIEDVKLGLMATNQAEDNTEQFFRRIALNIESYVNGTALSDMPVLIDYNSRLTINYNTANAVGVPIKYSLITTTDFVGSTKDVKAEKEYNLLSVMEGVLGRNLNLQASKKNVEISEQNVKSAKANYLPNVSASTSGTYIDPNVASTGNPEFSTGGDITLQQTIYSPQASANRTVQESLLKAQEENYNTDELNTIFNASNTYFNALIFKANAKIQMSNLDLTKKNLQIAEENFEAGESGKSDVLRFRSELAQNTQNMIQAINQMEQGYIGINQLLNNPIEMRINVEDAKMDEGLYKDFNYDQLTILLDSPTTREPFIEFLIQEAKNNAPELKSLDYNLIATERNIKLSGSDRFIPTIALQGQYNRTFSRSGVGSALPSGQSFINSNYNAGLSLNFPIFNQNLNNINKQTAIIQKDQLEINRQNSELNIASNVRNDVLNLVNQISNIELSKVSEETAKESLELTQVSYQEGAVNFIQLIDAQNNYLNAQLSRANATYNFLINAIQLERNIGYYFLLHTQTQNDEFTQRFQQYLLNKN